MNIVLKKFFEKHDEKDKHPGFSTFTGALALLLALARSFIAGHVRALSQFSFHLRRRAAFLVPR